MKSRANLKGADIESSVGLLSGAVGQENSNKKSLYGSALLDDNRKDTESDENSRSSRAHKQEDNEMQNPASYSELMRTNRAYRLLFAGWVLEEAGE